MGYRHHLAMLFAALALSLNPCAGFSSSPAGVPPLAPVGERFSIDGILDLAATGPVHQQSINIIDTFGLGALVKTTILRWAAQNDDRNIYIALEWGDITLDSFDPAVGMDNFDGVVVMFDNNGNGVLDANEDVHRLVMTNYGSIYSDLHFQGANPLDDAIGDGMGKLRYSSGKYYAEFLIPLVDDQTGEDGLLNQMSRFNLLIYDHIQIPIGAGNIGFMNGGPQLAVGTSTTSWPSVPYVVPTSAFDQPQIPANLTGLIAYISDHENPLGEIYTFNPATGSSVRVTNTMGIYIDGVSLSHDRTKLAFFGAPTSTDYANYEIYTVNVDGTNLQQITNNTILDGHPAWSPNDGELAYASFRAANKASIIRCSPAGVEILNLTPADANENDPDWLPGGKLVFKTDRFGTPGSPEVRIVSMNADGSGVIQLTNVAGTSDHDPTGTSTVVVFERFTKGTDYSIDPSSLYSPWNLVAAQLDGTSERNLIADAWINWLPVHDPSRQYIAFLKSVGYTDARLIDQNGRDLGRLIPGMTRVRYIDWK
jgi:hypothetical protein